MKIARRFTSQAQVAAPSRSDQPLRVGSVSLRVTAVLCAAFAIAATWCGSAFAAAPEATSVEPTGVGTGEAILHGIVDPGGEATHYHFEYGTTTAYGTSVPSPNGFAGSGEEGVAVKAHIAGLTPGTTYHFQLVAVNATGIAASDDATFSTYPKPVRSSGCTNELRREEQNSQYLPDCRAYEMVSPLDKNGTDLFGEPTITEASLDGNRASFAAPAGFGETTGSGAVGLTQYLATREEGGWHTHGFTPTPAREAFQSYMGNTVSTLFSGNLSAAVTRGYDLPSAAPAGVPGGENLYLVDTLTGGVRTLSAPTGVEIAPSLFTGFLSFKTYVVAGSADLKVVAFEAVLNLLPEAKGFSSKLYAWENGTLKLAGVLPDGSVPAGGSSEVRRSNIENGLENQHTVSEDGSRILFVAPASAKHQLYMRKNGSETAWVSEPEMVGAAAEPEHVEFLAANAEDTKVVFETTSRLLEADPGSGAGPVALYEYTDSPDPEAEGNLTFIARVSVGTGPKEAQENVAGMSESGERVYFFTHETSSFPETGEYLWERGTTRFVAATKEGVKQYTGKNSASREDQAEVSADGNILAFVANEALGGAHLAMGGGFMPVAAMYVYDAATETLTCASCLPTGLTARSGVEVLPHATRLLGGVNGNYQTRFLARDGRYVFFSTADPLVAHDTNNAYDVYEYDTETGRVALLSSGSQPDGSWLGAADENGENVMIFTRNELVPRDTDHLVDLYDVRVDGGFPQPKPEAGGCVGDECQGTPAAPPSFNTASGFHGEGNLVPAKPARKHHGGRRRSAKRRHALHKALKACKHRYRHNRRRRRRCKRQARRRYGAKASRRHRHRRHQANHNRHGSRR